MRNELITLIVKTGKTVDDSGFEVEGTSLETEIFARVKNVRATEFFQAYSEGIELSYVFCIDYDDWKNSFAQVEGHMVEPWAIEYEGKEFKIIRKYRTDMGELELSVMEADHETELQF